MSGWGAIALIVRRSLRQHALSTWVTAAVVGLAAGLVMTVFSLSTQSERAFTGGEIGFDGVVGARGSKLQLVLNSVFHLETSPGNIPWALYTTLRDDPRVRLAVPYAVGDNYYGYRIVGTTEELFTEFEYQEDKQYEFEGDGRHFDSTRNEAVVGSTVALNTGLKVGDIIQPYHGITFDPTHQHSDEYEIVGVLKPTNTPSDRVIWIPIEGIYRMDGHVLRGNDEVYVPEEGVAIPDEHKEVSSVMVKFVGPQVGFMFDQMINRQGKVATLAWPIGAVMVDLFQKLGWMSRVLEAVAYLVMLVAAGAILASLHNTMNERRREFAILRALGARRGTVFGAIVAESTAIAAIGSLLGYLVYYGIMTLAASIIWQQTGVSLDVWAPHPIFYWAPLGMVVLGALSGLLPAAKAYATDVAENLHPTT